MWFVYFLAASVLVFFGIIIGHSLCLWSIRKEYSVEQNINAESGDGMWKIYPLRPDPDPVTDFASQELLDE